MINFKPPKLILLDREGVILQHVDPYILQKEDIAFIPGSVWAIRQIAQHGISIAVVSNQSPVGRKLIERAFVDETNQWIREQLSLTEEQIQFYYCPHTPEDMCNCRKPRPQMLKWAMEYFEINPEHCWMVGDHDTDMQAGLEVPVKMCIHVTSGRQRYPSGYAAKVYKSLEEMVQDNFA